MKLSTKGRYGLMAMYRLAQNYGNGPLSLKEIATQEHLSEAYLEQLFSRLKKAKLVVSIRGAGGGYLLARSPGEIPIGEVIHALEGELSLSCCSIEVRPDCEKYGQCATRDILEKLQYQMEAVMDSMTLADM